MKKPKLIVPIMPKEFLSPIIMWKREEGDVKKDDIKINQRWAFEDFLKFLKFPQDRAIVINGWVVYTNGKEWYQLPPPVD